MRSAPNPFHRPVAPRQALRRVLAFGVALALLVVQFALQSHLVEHDLLPGAHQVCEQCVTAKSAAPPPAIATVSPDLVLAVAPSAAVVAQTDRSAPLDVRNRAPPSFA